MKIVCTVLLVLTSLPVCAQDKGPLSDRVMFWHGLSYSQMRLTPPSTVSFNSELGRFPHFDYTIGTHFLFLNANDLVSLGASWGVGAGFTIDDGLHWKVHSPAFLIARIGAESSPYNSSDVGFGLGVGGNFTYAQYRQDGILQAPATWLHPMLVLEYSAEIFTIRAQIGLSSPTKQGNFFPSGNSRYYPAGTTGPVRSSLFSVGYFMEI